MEEFDSDYTHERLEQIQRIVESRRQGRDEILCRIIGKEHWTARLKKSRPWNFHRWKEHGFLSERDATIWDYTMHLEDSSCYEIIEK